MKAFPYKSLTGQEWDNGMDLRDYFAARAMHSIIIYEQCDFNLKLIAQESYRIADAMMEARNE